VEILRQEFTDQQESCDEEKKTFLFKQPLDVTHAQGSDML